MEQVLGAVQVAAFQLWLQVVGGVVGASVAGGVVGTSAGAVVGVSVGAVVGSLVGGCVPCVPSVGAPVEFSVPLVVDGPGSLGWVVLLSSLLQAHRLSNMTKAKNMASSFFILCPFLSVKKCAVPNGCFLYGS